jgi:hypothetical protein
MVYLLVSFFNGVRVERDFRYHMKCSFVRLERKYTVSATWRISNCSLRKLKVGGK